MAIFFTRKLRSILNVSGKFERARNCPDHGKITATKARKQAAKPRRKRIRSKFSEKKHTNVIRAVHEDKKMTTEAMFMKELLLREAGP